MRKLVIERAGDCLRLSSPGTGMLQRPILFKQGSDAYFSLSEDTPLAGWTVISFGPWRLATEPTTWFAALSRAQTAQDALVRTINACPSLTPSPIPITAIDLRTIHASALTRDTLVALLGPLPKPLGVMRQTTSGPMAHAQGAFIFALPAPSLDSVVLMTPALDWEEVRYTLLHEWGHRWDQRRGQQLASWRRLPLPSRWQTREEWMADLFASALSCLSLAQSSPLISARVFQLCEARMPGTTRLGEELRSELLSQRSQRFLSR